MVRSLVFLEGRVQRSRRRKKAKVGIFTAKSGAKRAAALLCRKKNLCVRLQKYDGMLPKALQKNSALFPGP